MPFGEIRFSGIQATSTLNGSEQFFVLHIFRGETSRALVICVDAVLFVAFAAQGEGRHGVTEPGQEMSAVLDRRALAVECVAEHAQRPLGIVGRLEVGERPRRRSTVSK